MRHNAARMAYIEQIRALLGAYHIDEAKTGSVYFYTKAGVCRLSDHAQIKFSARRPIKANIVWGEAERSVLNKMNGEEK